MYPAYMVHVTTAVGLFAVKRLWVDRRLARWAAVALCAVLLGKLAMLLCDGPDVVLVAALWILVPVELATRGWPSGHWPGAPMPPSTIAAGATAPSDAAWGRGASGRSAGTTTDASMHPLTVRAEPHCPPFRWLP
jgi:hypothetical protein